MFIKFLSTKVDFSKNSIDAVIVPDTPDEPTEPDTPDEPTEPDTPDEPTEPDVPDDSDTVPEEMPTEYATFLAEYTRSNLTEDQKTSTYKYLYKLNKSGLMSKIRQLYMPCIMPDWDHCFLNIAKYFNNNVEEFSKVDLYSSSTLGRCFEVCDYGIYKTSDKIGWGDCLSFNWTDEDVTCNNWHILMFKPAQQDASTGVHSGGLNLRSRPGAAQKIAFNIAGETNTTRRMRSSFASGSMTIGDAASVTIKNSVFVEPTGWGNGTHDPFCVGISMLSDRMVTPSSSYQEFLNNNRNLVNEITEWELTGNYEIPATPMTGDYSWGGYLGSSISMQQNLATSIVSIGTGLNADEIQSYMDITNEFMVGMGINNDNWDPDNLS